MVTNGVIPVARSSLIRAHADYPNDRLLLVITGSLTDLGKVSGSLGLLCFEFFYLFFFRFFICFFVFWFVWGQFRFLSLQCSFGLFSGLFLWLFSLVWSLNSFLFRICLLFFFIFFSLRSHFFINLSFHLFSFLISLFPFSSHLSSVLSFVSVFKFTFLLSSVSPPFVFSLLLRFISFLFSSHYLLHLPISYSPFLCSFPPMPCSFYSPFLPFLILPLIS